MQDPECYRESLARPRTFGGSPGIGTMLCTSVHLAPALSMDEVYIPFPPISESPWGLAAQLDPLISYAPPARAEIVEYVVAELHLDMGEDEESALVLGLCRQLGEWWMEDQIEYLPQHPHDLSLQGLAAALELPEPKSNIDPAQATLYRIGAFYRLGASLGILRDSTKEQVLPKIESGIPLGELSCITVMNRLLRSAGHSFNQGDGMTTSTSLKGFRWAVDHLLPPLPLLGSVPDAEIRAERFQRMRQTRESWAAAELEDSAWFLLRSSLLPRHPDDFVVRNPS